MEENIQLKEITIDDYSFVYELIKNFLKTNLSVTFLSLPSFDEFKKSYFKNDFMRYIIFNHNLEKLGFVVITNDDEIGYFVDKKFQNKGYGSKAVSMLIQLHPRPRYFATVHNENHSSIKLISKLGFVPKATIFEKVEEKTLI